jgi:hypothetical protein
MEVENAAGVRLTRDGFAIGSPLVPMPPATMVSVSISLDPRSSEAYVLRSLELWACEFFREMEATYNRDGQFQVRVVVSSRVTSFYYILLFSFLLFLTPL